MKISGGCWPAPRAASPSEKAERILAARDLEPQERLDWLRLCRSESIGPVTFYALLRRFGSAAAALDALPRLSRPAVATGRRDAEVELAAVERLGGRIVCWGEPLYPSALAAVEDAPPVLTQAVWKHREIAVVADSARGEAALESRSLGLRGFG